MRKKENEGERKEDEKMNGDNGKLKKFKIKKEGRTTS